MARFSILGLLAFASACASTPTSVQWLDVAAAKKGKPNLIVCRPITYTYGAFPLFVWVDGQRVGKLGAGEEITLHIPEGQRSLALRWPAIAMVADKEYEIEVSAEQGVAVGYAQVTTGTRPAPGGVAPAISARSELAIFDVEEGVETSCFGRGTFLYE